MSMDDRGRRRVGDDDERGPVRKYGAYVLLGVVGLLTLMTLWGTSYTIQEVERGVLTRNGAFVQVVRPGWNWKMPWIDDVVEYQLTDQFVTFVKEESFTYDSQAAFLKFSLTYAIKGDDAAIRELYLRGGADVHRKNVIETLLLKVGKEVFSKYTADRAIRNRQQLNIDIEKAVIEAIHAASGIALVKQVQVTDISFNRAYMDVLDARAQAEIAVLTERQKEEREKVTANITVIQAKAVADSNLAKSEAEAKGIQLVGNAQAEAIKARAQALGQNPLLIQLTAAEKWNGELPQSMPPNSAVPFLSLPQPQR